MNGTNFGEQTTMTVIRRPPVQLPLMYRITPAAQRYHVIRGGDGMGAEGAYAWHTIA